MPARADAKSTLSRSRTNRITNKTRLRVLVGNYDVEPILEDVEGVDYHTHGVEAHESTETHLQRALSATTLRVLGAGIKQSDKQAARAAAADAIPIPDASGVVADGAKLYPSGKFKDHVLHLRFSDTVEESVASGLAGGYTYYMDERDKAWLDKNNQEARGEGSSTQAVRAASSSSSQGKRNGKGKDVVPAVEMSEDEFELVMGLFERRAADPPFPFLHLDPDSFPTMEVYEEWFQTPLSAELFSSFTVPPDVPEPTRLLELARCVYAHWRERRIERGGHRIIPQLSLDETGANDSYTCFRRRELRPVRRTRRQQDSSAGDPMLQLRRELGSCLDLARQIAKREVLKQKCVAQNRELAEARLSFVRLKRENRSLGERGDEGLLYDKEQKVRKKKPPAISLSINTSTTKRPEPVPRKPREPTDRASPVTIVEMPNYARQRAEEIQLSIDKDLARQKQDDVGFDDVLDAPYPKVFQPGPQRLFKAPPGPGRLLTSAARANASTSFRLRVGRGGRMVLDRSQRREPQLTETDRHPAPSPATSTRAPEEAEETGIAERQRDRWMFDADAVIEPDGEGSRLLVDDFQTDILRSRSTLVHNTDYALYFQPGYDSRHSSSSSPSIHISPSTRSPAGRRRPSAARPPAPSPSRATPAFTVPTPSTAAGPAPAATVPPTPSSAVPPAPTSAVPPNHHRLPAASPARPIAPAASGLPPSAGSTQPVVPSPLARQPPVPVPVKAEARIAPAKPRLRLADSDVQVKSATRSRPAKTVDAEVATNGKPSGGVPRTAYPHLQGNPVPVLSSRANFTPFMHNGHNGDAQPPAQTNGNGRASSAGANGHSRSPSAESSRAAATSESASVSESTGGSQ